MTRGGYYWRLKVGAKYDPGQPRVPAGDPRGGQWTNGAPGSVSGANQRVQAALTTVLEHATSDDREISISLDENGNEISRDTGRYDPENLKHNVSVVPAPVVMHSHPKNEPPSLDDMAIMFRHQGIQDLYTVTPDGTVYKMSRTDRTPKNEWPGRVEQEFYKVDDALPGMRQFISDMESELGRRVTINEAFLKRQDRVMERLADVMGLSYEKWVMAQ